MPYTIAIHGGAGALDPSTLPIDAQSANTAVLEAVVKEAAKALATGAAALDVVETAVRRLEEAEAFNAGRGAALVSDGSAELDAAVMSHGDGGAVACVRTTRNPVSLARRVMEASPHVLLMGQGADAFAHAQGLEQVDNAWFVTNDRSNQLRRSRAGQVTLDHDTKGTVGAVALDQQGRLAAATSTGGMTNQAPGRVGDTPILGAGTWSDDRVAVSGTGHGEYFIRIGVARRVSMLMEMGLSLNEAGQRVIDEDLHAAGGRGGLIAVDTLGGVAMPFNTGGMYRAAQGSEAPFVIGIW